MICNACWDKTEGDRNEVRVIPTTTHHCVECGDLTDSGIWVRRDVPDDR